MATQESNPFENLPRDLITEILSRLPVKSLLRCRCVSKSWISHISSPEFETTQLEVSTTRPRLIFGCINALYTCSLRRIFVEQHPSVDDAPFDFSSDDPHGRIRIVSSCKGLICLVMARSGYIIVLNPATRKYRRIRSSFKIHFGSPFGFGYDASSDDYKVLNIVYGSSTANCRTYSLRNNSWKSSDWPHGGTMVNSGVCVNGAIHWIVRYSDRDIGWHVVAQSLAAVENIWSVALPLPPKECRLMSAFLGVSGERLCLCFYRGFSFDVWAMEEYGVTESWRKVACIPMLVNFKLRMGAPISDMKNLVLVKVDSKFMSQIPFDRREIIIQSNGHLMDQPTTYVESIANPNLDRSMKLKDGTR